MERMITNLFDFQRFLQDPKLASIILDTEDRCGRALSDDDLEWVSAAGEEAPQPSSEGYVDTFLVITEETEP